MISNLNPDEDADPAIKLTRVLLVDRKVPVRNPTTAPNGAEEHVANLAAVRAEGSQRAARWSHARRGREGDSPAGRGGAVELALPCSVAVTQPGNDVKDVFNAT